MAPSAQRRAPATIIASEADIARGVRSLQRRCPVMRKVYKATGMPPLRRREPGLEGLLRIVVGQQVSVASANAIWTRCAAAIQPMSANQIASLSDDDLKGCGLSRPKIRTLRAISSAIRDGRLDLDGAAQQSDEALRTALLDVSGIGPWTADVYQMFCVGRADVFAPGDLALQVAAQHAFDLTDRPGPELMAELAEPWRPWRAVSARLLWAYYAVLKQGRSGIGI